MIVVVAAGVGTLASIGVINVSPAFNKDLRHDSILGNWRAVPQNALYDSSHYYYEIGTGFLRGDFADLVRNDGLLPPIALYDLRLEEASQMFRASVELSPGREDAWLGLAWAELLIGNSETALEALRNSWSLAPFDTSAARERLYLINALNDEYGVVWQTRDDRALIVEDILTVEDRDLGTLGALSD